MLSCRCRPCIYSCEELVDTTKENTLRNIPNETVMFGTSTRCDNLAPKATSLPQMLREYYPWGSVPADANAIQRNSQKTSNFTATDAGLERLINADQELVARALKTLKRRFLFVAFQDSFSRSLRCFEGLVGKKSALHVYKVNARRHGAVHHRSGGPRKSVTERLRKLVEEHNSLDMTLYRASICRMRMADLRLGLARPDEGVPSTQSTRPYAHPISRWISGAVLPQAQAFPAAEGHLPQRPSGGFQQPLPMQSSLFSPRRRCDFPVNRRNVRRLQKPVRAAGCIRTGTGTAV
ncbi:hypothetical protein CYMTET_26302 [Cymbomonas tetramitiformis]|uniref:Uncharacterized protein n=1 Tax=Cymbomonas tetramitiformis TaxID=36881 RepID=A0AAE0FS48_9CHLO|nr:hypothetical protein CYMTET_26302 [Cymbomonas tetramitiformis]